MLKHRTGLFAAAGAVAAAGVIATTGVVAASAAPHPGISGTETFQIMSTSATSSAGSVIANGVFTAGGTQKGNRASSTLTFPSGTVTLAHSKGTGSQHVNPKTCLVTIALSGTFTVTGGTGSYAGITGSGSYKLTGLGVANKVSGKCSLNAQPQAFQEVIRATGTVTLP